MHAGSEYARWRAACVNSGDPLVLGWAANRMLYEWRLLVCSLQQNSLTHDTAEIAHE